MILRSEKRLYRALAVAFVLLMLATRFASLAHEMDNHPDERSFIHASSAMAELLFTPGSEYSELKPYPEGAYIFYAPFQVLRLAAEKWLAPSVSWSARAWNRVGASIYSALAGLLGCALLIKHFRSRSAALVFGVSLLFSLFFIEQTRYGTGDTISFLLMMLLLWLLAEWIVGEKPVHLFLSCLIVGFLGAVKYPQLYFALLIVAALVVKRPRLPFWHYLLCAFLIALGFFIISPELMRDPVYYLKSVIKRESNAYLLVGNQSEIGGFFNHALSLLIYWFVYSDIPLAPVFFALACLSAGKRAFKGGGRAPSALSLPRGAAGDARFSGL